MCCTLRTVTVCQCNRRFLYTGEEYRIEGSGSASAYVRSFLFGLVAMQQLV